MLGTSSRLLSPPPPLRLAHLIPWRINTGSEQTGCAEVLAFGAWQAHEPGLPRAWGSRPPHTGCSPPTPQTGASCVPGSPRLQGRGGEAASNTWVSVLLFSLRLQKISPSLISWDKERKILLFPRPGEEWGPKEGEQRPEVTEQDKDMILVGKGLCLMSADPRSQPWPPAPCRAGWFSVWAAASELSDGLSEGWTEP